MATQPLTKFQQARLALREAEDRLWKTLKSEFPEGRNIAWLWRGTVVCWGTVIRHGFGDRVFVQNSRTHARSWIHAYQIIVTEQTK